MCLAFGVERLDDVAAKLADVLEMQPPQGLGEKLRGLQKLKSIADSRPKTRPQRRLPGGRAARRRRRPRRAAGADLLAGRRRAVHHAAGRDHARPEHRPAQRRHVPHAGARPALDGHALAAAQGRPHGLPRERRAHGGRGRARARPGDGVQRERPAAEAHRRADVRGLPARRGGRGREGRHRRPRGAGERGVRARGLRRARRPHDRGPVRRPHRLLHAARAVPRLPRDGADDAARRDLSVDRRRASRRPRTRGSARRRSGSSCRRSARPCPSSSTTTCRSRARSTTA